MGNETVKARASVQNLFRYTVHPLADMDALRADAPTAAAK
jgi:hypothetical protein